MDSSKKVAEKEGDPSKKADEALFNEDSLFELIDKEDLKTTSYKLFVIALFIMVLVTGTNIWESYKKYTDETIQLVKCAKNFELGAPTLLKVIRDVSPKEKDIWVRSFVANYVINQFPINKIDARPTLKFVVDHSEGAVKRMYSARINNIDKFEDLIQRGFYYERFSKDPYDIRIRSRGEGKWSVEVDSYLVHNSLGSKIGKNVILTYEIRVGDHTLSNPEGLYVVDANMDTYKDMITGEKND